MPHLGGYGMFIMWLWGVMGLGPKHLQMVYSIDCWIYHQGERPYHLCGYRPVGEIVSEKARVVVLGNLQGALDHGKTYSMVAKAISIHIVLVQPHNAGSSSALRKAVFTSNMNSLKKSTVPRYHIPQNHTVQLFSNCKRCYMDFVRLVKHDMTLFAPFSNPSVYNIAKSTMVSFMVLG